MSTPADRAIDLFVAKMIDAFFDNPHTENPLNIKSKEEVELVCREIRRVCHESLTVYTVKESVEKEVLECHPTKDIKPQIKNRLMHKMAEAFLSEEGLTVWEREGHFDGSIEFTANVAVVNFN